MWQFWCSSGFVYRGRPRAAMHTVKNFWLVLENPVNKQKFCHASNNFLLYFRLRKLDVHNRMQLMETLLQLILKYFFLIPDVVL